MRPFLRGDSGALRAAAHGARAEPAFPLDHLSRIPRRSQIELHDGVQPFSLAASTTAAIPGQRAFSTAGVAWCCDHVAATVTGLVRLEMIECLRTTSG